MRNPSFLWDEPGNAGDESDRLAAALRTVSKEFAQGRTGGPITLAIYGPWGSGKTTVLRQLRAELKEQQAITIWFDPWRYEREADLMVPLLTELTSGIAQSGKMSRDAKEAAVKTGYKLLGRVAKAGLRASAGFVASKIGMDAGDIERLGEEFMKHYEDEASRFEYPVSERQRFTEDFQKLITLASSGKKTGKLADDSARPVCVLIDDLDRCDPEKVKTLLESMKNFMWVPGVIYVLAVDREQVTTAIAEPFVKMFGDRSPEAYAEARERARAYLEKFFLHSLDIGDDAAGYRQYTVAPAKAAMFGELKAALPTERKNDLDAAEIRSIYDQCSDNLRRIKRVLRWLYFAALEGAFQGADKSFPMARLADQVFAESFPTIWLDLFDGESTDVKAVYYQRLYELLAFCSSEVGPNEDRGIVVDDPNLQQMQLALIEPEGRVMMSESGEEYPSGEAFVVAAPFRNRRSGAYLSLVLAKRDVRAIERLHKLSQAAMKLDLPRPGL